MLCGILPRALANFVLRECNVKKDEPFAVSYTHLDVYKRQIKDIADDLYPKDGSADNRFQNITGKIQKATVMKNLKLKKEIITVLNRNSMRKLLGDIPEPVHHREGWYQK